LRRERGVGLAVEVEQHSVQAARVDDDRHSPSCLPGPPSRRR
jgi:hypothetical protein